VIAVKGVGANRPFSALATNVVPDLEMISKGQVFPLYYYEPVTENPGFSAVAKLSRLCSKRCDF
jgi:predicted helicase